MKAKVTRYLMTVVLSSSVFSWAQFAQAKSNSITCRITVGRPAIQDTVASARSIENVQIPLITDDKKGLDVGHYADMMIVKGGSEIRLLRNLSIYSIHDSMGMSLEDDLRENQINEDEKSFDGAYLLNVDFDPKFNQLTIRQYGLRYDQESRRMRTFVMGTSIANTDNLNVISYRDEGMKFISTICEVK